MLTNTHFASPRKISYNRGHAVQPNVTFVTTFTINKKLAEQVVDDFEEDKLHLKSPYYSRYNFYPERMGFPAETAVTSIAKKVDCFKESHINDFFEYNTHYIQKNLNAIKNNQNIYLTSLPEKQDKMLDELLILDRQIRNTLIFYLNMHEDQDSPVTLSSNIIEKIEKTLSSSINICKNNNMIPIPTASIGHLGTKRNQSPIDANTESPLKKIRSKSPVPSPQEKSSSDKTASSHHSGSVFTSENSLSGVSHTFRSPISSPTGESVTSFKSSDEKPKIDTIFRDTLTGKLEELSKNL